MTQVFIWVDVDQILMMQHLLTDDKFVILTTGGPCYSLIFYLRIRLFTSAKTVNLTIFQSNIPFLSANSRYAVKK
jgi:hypothetical protein